MKGPYAGPRGVKMVRTVLAATVRALDETVMLGVARLATVQRRAPREIGSIVVLRNNDLGDVLVSTPLFAALRTHFPKARIAAAVGRWSVPILSGNPNLDEIIVCDAPWFNKFTAPQSRMAILRFVSSSAAARRLAAGCFDVGIDVLGSVWGSLLFLRAGIPLRLGVRGYAGGHSAAQLCVAFNPGEHVARSSLRFAELLGATSLPLARPQLFLSDDERVAGEEAWHSKRRRLVMAPGGGLAQKLWPAAHYEELIRLLDRDSRIETIIVTGPSERTRQEDLVVQGSARPLPDLSLRQTFGLIAAADAVVCNSSMPLHVAAAFSKPAVVTLGPSFASGSAHQAQWGYPGLSVSLGRESGPDSPLATPPEAFAAVRDALGLGPE